MNANNDDIDYDLQVLIVVNGVKFQCNPNVLTAVSGYFQALFRNKTFKENLTAEINVSGPVGDEFSSAVIQVVINFARTRHIVLTEENVFPVFQAADYFDIKELQRLCILYLKRMINCQNWVKIFRFASQLCLVSVTSACIKKFNDVHASLDYHHILLPEFESILKIQHSKMSPAEVLNAVMRWFKCDKVARAEYIDQLLVYVEFKRLSIRYVSNRICCERIFTERPDLVADICRKLANRRLLLIGGLGKEAEKSVVKYNPRTETFAQCSTSPNRCHASAFTEHRNRVIVVGGTGNASNIQTYDVEQNTWALYSLILRTPTCFAGCAIVNEKLYIVGGYDFRKKTRLSNIQVFDVNSEGFSYSSDHKILPLQCARTDHAVVSVNDLIYVIGGFDAQESFLSSCEVINTTTHERYQVASMNEGRSHHAVVVLDGFIYAIGGKCESGRLSSAERYSIENDSWVEIAPMKVAR